MRGPLRLTMSALAALGVLGGLLGPAIPAHAAGTGALACGQTITVDTTLTADLTGCVGPGLVIGANGITLDLAGHTIAGDGRADVCPGNLYCDVGIDDGAGYSDVTITGGGTVRGFVVGVQAAAPARHLRLERLTIRDNSRFGAWVHGGDDAVYARDVFADNGTSGLLVVDAHRVQVTRNTVTGSAGYGMVCSTSTPARSATTSHGLTIMAC